MTVQASTVVMGNAPNVFDVPIAKIVANPKNNYRTSRDPDALAELAESIKRQGQLQPVEVAEMPDGRFDLILGFRRYEAFTQLGLPTIRVQVVRAKDGAPIDDKSRRLRNATENLAREDLTPYDQALAFQDLKKNHELSAGVIAANVGVSVPHINNLVRVLDMASEPVIARWKEESHPSFGVDKEGKSIPNTRQVCTMNWLTTVIKLPKAEQEFELKKALGLVEDPDDVAGDDEDGDSNREPKAGAPKRATMNNLLAALEAAEKQFKAAKNDRERAVLDGIKQALKFASGKNMDIKDVYRTPRPGEPKPEKKDKEKDDK